MKDARPYSVELETEKMQFLEEMAKKFSLQDASKAVRCLVNYARENPEKHDEIFADIRCLDC